MDISDSFSVLELAHAAMRRTVRPGDLCIDATMGRGRDTAFLCGLVGEAGRVLAFDIQPEAVESTRGLLEKQGLAARAALHLDSHSNLDRYAQPGTCSCVAFNFGWLPAGDHSIFTRAETSVPALEQSLRLLRPGGILSLCIYYGRENGYAERDALLAFLAGLDSRKYTAIRHDFINRGGEPPLFVLVTKDKEDDR